MNLRNLLAVAWLLILGSLLGLAALDAWDREADADEEITEHA